jgi:hypothetical protein
MQQTGIPEKELPHWWKRKQLIEDIFHMVNHRRGTSGIGRE